MRIYQNHQHTLRKKIRCEGIGVHSGDSVALSILPADVHTGIVFERVDLSEHNRIPAQWNRVVDTLMCTRLANDHGVTISTVEHLMAALFACGIDNARIQVNGSELPIMDGSSFPFITLIRQAGIQKQSALRRYIRIQKPVQFSRNDLFARIAPSDQTLSLNFQFDFRGRTLFPAQSCTYTVDQDSFDVSFAPARTFGILEEVNKLWDAGLAKGGSLDNAVVVSGDKILNEGGLRFTDEFVRHKILDAVGDLYLGGPILGEFEAYNAGHGINNQLLRTVMEDATAWEYVTFSEPLLISEQTSDRKADFSNAAYAVIS